jgi:hypothetical protein
MTETNPRVKLVPPGVKRTLGPSPKSSRTLKANSSVGICKTDPSCGATPPMR